MNKIHALSAGLIAAAIFAAPAVAREKAWYSADGTRVDPSHVHYVKGRHCIRAPDVGAYATAPYKRPPCEPAFWY
jgi:hypothetical protein